MCDPAPASVLVGHDRGRRDPRPVVWAHRAGGAAAGATQVAAESSLVSSLLPTSQALSEARLADLEPAWAESAACRTIGRAGRLSAARSGLCETMGISDTEAE